MGSMLFAADFEKKKRQAGGKEDRTRKVKLHEERRRDSRDSY